MQINIGTHTLKLYQPPVPDPSQIPFDEIPSHNDWRRYKKSTIRIHIFQGNPRPGSLTPSDLSEDGEEVLPEYSWLPCERSKAPRDPFLSGDGFDVYVDGCRFLPDSVTFTKVCFNGSSFLYFSICDSFTDKNQRARHCWTPMSYQDNVQWHIVYWCMDIHVLVC